MSILTSRTKLHSLAVIVAFGTLAFLANAASARVVQIGGTHSKAEIGAKCATAGGMTEHGKGGGYGCFNQNKGTSVDCDAKGHCVGWVPRRASSGGGLRGVLGEGVSATGGARTRRGAANTASGFTPGPSVARDHRGPHGAPQGSVRGEANSAGPIVPGDRRQTTIRDHR